MVAARIVPAACVAVVLAAGCGSGGSGGGGKPPSAAQLTRGKKVFVAGCGSCHSLRAAGTKGLSGGPLDGLGLSETSVADRVRRGSGGMPAFAKTLTPAQIADVAAFVSHSSH